MKPARPQPRPIVIPNWLLGSGIIFLLSLGALKIAWGLYQLYR